MKLLDFTTEDSLSWQHRNDLLRQANSLDINYLLLHVSNHQDHWRKLCNNNYMFRQYSFYVKYPTIMASLLVGLNFTLGKLPKHTTDQVRAVIRDLLDSRRAYVNSDGVLCAPTVKQRNKLQ